MAEDKGLVHQRRVYDTPVGPREMLGPYDITFRKQAQLESLMEQREKALSDESGSALRQIQFDMLNCIFVPLEAEDSTLPGKPFSDEELLDLVPLEVARWVSDFFEDFEKSSEVAAGRAVAQVSRTQRRVKSAQRSKPTTKRATR